MWCYRGVVERVWCIKFMVREVGGSSLRKSGSNCSTTNYRHEWHLITSRMALDTVTNSAYHDSKVSLKGFSLDGVMTLH